MVCFKFQVFPMFELLYVPKAFFAFDAKCLRGIYQVNSNSGGLLGFTMVLWSATNEDAIVIL